MKTPDLENARLLVVDDQEANIFLLEDILEDAGYKHVKSIQDSRLAVSTFAEFKPDIVLLDLMMPHLDGFGVMEQLRPLFNDDPYLPILVLTADVNPEVKRKALASGAKDFLTKPLDPIEVQLRIKNLLLTRLLYRQLQQRADERIKELAELIDLANDAILVQDTADRILFWNKGADRLYGWSADEVMGQNGDAILFKGQEATLNEAKTQFLKEGKWSAELEQSTKAGKKVIVVSRWTRNADAEKRPHAKLVINTDITEKKRLESLFIQAQRLEGIGLLAGGVAHDFNNLLTIILGFSELVLSNMGPIEPSRQLIEEIHKAGTRAAWLTRQLLTFCRKQVIAPVILDLNSLISDIEKMLRRLTGENVTLSLALERPLGRVKTDPGQIEQILINLAVNARDAMPMGGHLVIATKNVVLDEEFTRRDKDLRPGPYILLTVSDTGCGMNEDTRNHIFDPFFTTKEVGKGTGLGLATVYGIVKQNNGFIDVESEPKRGATFKIYLPRIVEATTAAPPGTTTSQLAKGKETILLAEDEEEIRSLARLALQSVGYIVLEARDGEDALAISRKHPGTIDLLVTDVVMPRKSGRQVAEALVAQRPHLKVLYLSGYTEDAILRHGIQKNDMAFLSKPFTVASLTKKVREVLDKPAHV